MTTTPTTVALLGTGAIGTTIARVLLDDGHHVRAWNRSAPRTDEVRALGASVHRTPTEAVDGAELVLLTLTNYVAVTAVLETLQPVAGRPTSVVLTTGTPEDAVDAAGRAAGLGFAPLDGGVQTAPEDIGTPAALFLLSGDAEAYARHREVFDRLGTVRFVGASASAAATWDLALFGVWYDAQLGLLRALEAADTHGIDVRVFAETAQASLGHAASSAIATAQEMIERSYPRGPATLREHLPVLDQLAALHADSEVSGAGFASVAARVRALIDAGFETDGLTRLLEPLLDDNAGGQA